MMRTERDGTEACPACKGVWLPRQALEENEVLKRGDEGKGDLMLESQTSHRQCPQCGALMRSFEYRLHHLHLDFCTDGHGYWLDAEEKHRVLALMRKEEADGKAEDRFAAYLTHLRSGSFLDRLRGWATIIVDPKPKPKF
jgi:Zn-finger nucleic acid-binding protein